MRNFMKVIFSGDIQQVGKKYEMKEVRDGYARNFLFPRKLAKLATEQALKMLATQKEHDEKKHALGLKMYKNLIEKLKTITLHFKMKVGETGRAFGSVTMLKIKNELKEQGIEIEKEWVDLPESLKKTGEYMVKIKFPNELFGEVKVVIDAE